MTVIYHPDIKVYTEIDQGKQWLNRYSGCRPIFTCTLAFTATALIPHISTAGITSKSRRYTALADAEFLVNGIQRNPIFPLPVLSVGISPTFISRAVIEKFDLPLYIFNAGLLQSPSVKHIDLGGKSAHCVSTGKALPQDIVYHLYQQGLYWGEILAKEAKSSYLLLSECVVGGTTTALAVLTALGICAQGKVNSSHPQCNHQQKWLLVEKGLKKANLSMCEIQPLKIIAAVGDPMQIFVAGMALSASKTVGVMLAGGTQMLAIFALIKALKNTSDSEANLENIIVATTRWVAEDSTGDTIGLSKIIGNISLCATNLNFTTSSYSHLQAYEKGYVKEGVGAGGSAIATHLLNLNKNELLYMVEAIISRFHMTTNS